MKIFHLFIFILLALIVPAMAFQNVFTHAVSSNPHNLEANHAPSFVSSNCIIQLPSGSTILDTSNVRFPDGNLHHFSSTACSNGNAPTISWDWVEYASKNYGDGSVSGFTYLADQWTVPHDPTNQQNNVIFLFNSLQWFNPQGSWIIQPVLGWGCLNPLCTAGGHYWSLTDAVVFQSYDGSPFNPAYESGAPSTAWGHTIQGTISWQSYTNQCGEPMYQISETDVTTGAQTVLNFCTDTLGMQADPGVLEVYNIASCDEYPSASSVGTVFQNIQSTPSVGTLGNWDSFYDSGVSPQCSYGASPTFDGGAVYLYWNSGTGGGGGGCIALNTPILTSHGYRPVQSLRTGDIIIGYDLAAGRTEPVKVLSNTVTWESSLININDGALLLTATDQPIYASSSTFTGWVRDPQSLKVGESIYNVFDQRWVPIYNIQAISERTMVYDLVTSGPNDFIANGYLLDTK